MINDLLNLFFPNFCYSCATILSSNQNYFCVSCQNKVAYFDNSQPDNNKIHLSLFNKIPLFEGFSLLEYRKNSSVQELVHDLKYAKQKEIATFFAKQLAVQIKTYSSQLPDYIIAVPMHQDKLKSRGYNQAELIAQSVAEDLTIEMVSNGILKTKHTNTQTHLNRIQRWQNAAEVFTITTNLHAKHILLVDDVITTGATFEALGKECIKAGAIKISVATLAIAV